MTKVIDLNYVGIVFVVLAYISSSFADRIWLIQAWDLVPVACLFMWIGAEFREHYPAIERKRVLLITIAFAIWILGLENKIYIDMAMRVFPNFIFSMIFIISASYCIIYFSEGISSTKLGNYLAFFGRETLPLLYINTIDFFLAWGYLSTFSRILLDIFLDWN
ncbi:hypothetical protein LMB56_09485 [Limosilactobacillus reuteri]|uniref:hypothetical protein n=1 Tax=Limosilactobacillus reuteri TaxID=1598 RepID=UPI001E5AADD2|nr:hypothetical protein [Limosilactobacillus reuteri]MCC4322824.1 hypothetical protein [Limosilactobacillus reuteri]MCC4333221.1 hypothetical protein [Limosilactobacillus reuteri]MCC4436655.1 hypothetical protein [Limosilactobacillus reuteri]MCC4438810.1 hypothetical protein [Limosilactobacillus reuteri]MCC4442817.1 hypothetical protein [Limosilactobacillus reuteri]